MERRCSVSDLHLSLSSLADLVLGFDGLHLTLGIILIVLKRVVVALAIFDESVVDVDLSKAPLEILTLVVLVASNRCRSVDLETIDPGFVATATLLGVEGGVNLEQDGVERGTEVRAINGGMARRLGVVDILTFRAVQLHSALVRQVGLANGQERMAIAHHTGALSKVAFLVFLKLPAVRTNHMFGS